MVSVHVNNMGSAIVKNYLQLALHVVYLKQSGLSLLDLPIQQAYLGSQVGLQRYMNKKDTRHSSSTHRIITLVVIFGTEPTYLLATASMKGLGHNANVFLYVHHLFYSCCTTVSPYCSNVFCCSNVFILLTDSNISDLFLFCITQYMLF